MSTQQTKSLLHTGDFEALNEQYGRRLHASIRRFIHNPADADDLTAATFAIAWAKRESFRGEAAPYSWLYTIASNLAKEHFRRGQRFQLKSIDDVGVAANDGETEALETSECRLRLRKALGQVTSMHRRVLIDHFIHGHSVKQIAKRQRIPVGTVLSRIFGAKRALRTAWEAAT